MDLITDTSAIFSREKKKLIESAPFLYDIIGVGEDKWCSHKSGSPRVFQWKEPLK